MSDSYVLQHTAEAIDHKRDLIDKNKNLLPYPYIDSETNLPIKFSAELEDIGDGSILVIDTTTSTIERVLATCPLLVGKKYTVSLDFTNIVDTTISVDNPGFELRVEGGGKTATAKNDADGKNSSAELDLTDVVGNDKNEIAISVKIVIPAGVNSGLLIKPQIEEGEEKTDWVPYMDKIGTYVDRRFNGTNAKLKVLADKSPISLGEGVNSIIQKNTSCKAIGEAAQAFGRSSTAVGLTAHAEGLGCRVIESLPTTPDISDITINAVDNVAKTISVVGASLIEVLDKIENHGAALHISEIGYFVATSAVISESKDSVTFFLAVHPDDYDISNLEGKSIVEIYTGIALGEGAHSEGRYTVANGEASHAEGLRTKAIRNMTHAEGQDTTARGYASHAEGYKTTAVGLGSHIEGGAGTHNDTKYSDYDTLKKEWDVERFAQAHGEHSHVEGYNNIAWGNKSHAEGGGTHAIGERSHAEGYDTSACGDASHTEGHGTIAIGDYSHTEGEYTNASGKWAHAEGYNTVAIGSASHIEGGSKAYNETKYSDYAALKSDWDVEKFAQAHGSYSHVEGCNNIAWGNFSHAEGEETTTSGQWAHAEGYKTTASGYGSHAEGRETTASNDFAHAEGRSTTASGEYSHAEGEQTKASNTWAHAEGYKTTASGYGSHAEGRETTASNDFAHAEGRNTKALHKNSHAAGLGTITGRDSQTVVGQYNSADTNALLVVGNGDKDTKRSNAFTVNADGTATIGTAPVEPMDVVNKQYLEDKLASDNFNPSGTYENLTAGKAVRDSDENVIKDTYAKKSEIPTVPTEVSTFNNDAGYLTSIPSEYITESDLEDKGYLTEHQDLSGYAKKGEIPTTLPASDVYAWAKASSKPIYTATEVGASPANHNHNLNMEVLKILSDAVAHLANSEGTYTIAFSVPCTSKNETADGDVSYRGSISSTLVEDFEIIESVRVKTYSPKVVDAEAHYSGNTLTVTVSNKFAVETVLVEVEYTKKFAFIVY